MDCDFQYRGKTALVTGASSGIGREFAFSLAARGADLLLVARSERKLRKLAHELSRGFVVHVEVLPADLAEPRGSASILRRTETLGRRVDLLVNNAGVGGYGAFAKHRPAEELRREIALNVAAVAELTHGFLPGMLDKREGAILNVASTGAFQPAPYMAVYAASKAFVLSFSEALWAECRPHGVRVLAVCPGPVRTRFWDGWGGEDPRVYAPLVGAKSSKRVVADALRAVERGKSFVIPGWRNYLLAQTVRLTPRAMVARISERVNRIR